MKTISFKNHAHIDVLIKQLSKVGLKVPRHKMPQITGDNFEDFKRWLSDQRITAHKKQITPSQFKATQKDFNKNKIIKMLKHLDISNPSNRPILISNDGYILDGHHRWAAHWIKDDLPLNALEINLSVKKALHIMNSYDNVFYKKINEGKAVNECKATSDNLS